MKKIFYAIVLILVLVLVVNYVRKDNQTEAVNEYVDEVNVADVIACDCDAPCNCASNDINCECAASRAACNCDAINGGDEITVDEFAEEVEEENPDETSHEDETIIAE